MMKRNRLSAVIEDNSSSHQPVCHEHARDESRLASRFIAQPGGFELRAALSHMLKLYLQPNFKKHEVG